MDCCLALELSGSPTSFKKSTPTTAKKGARVTTALLALSVLCAATLAMVVLWRRPVLTVGLYLAALTLTPYWLGVNVSYFFVSVQVVMAVVALVVLVTTPGPAVRIKLPDVVMAAVVALLVVGFVFFRTPASSVYIFISQWLPAYCVGRMAMSRCGEHFARTFGLVMIIPAALGIVEFATGFNPWTKFVVVHNSLYATWATEQSRGGFVRAEASFGHSIAFGCVLALAAVFVLASNLSRRLRLAIVFLMLVSSALTISRTGMICAVIGVVLFVLLDNKGDLRDIRKPLLWSLAAGGLVVAAYLVYVLAAAGPGAANSAFYRLWILDLLPTLHPVGLASSAVALSNGSTVFAGYHSIDSAVLYFALQNGWVPAVLLASLPIAAVVLLVRGRISPALVAIVAQFPAYVSVALITQYAMVLFLIGGVAVATAPPRVWRRPGPDNGFEWQPAVTRAARGSASKAPRADGASADGARADGGRADGGRGEPVVVGSRAAHDVESQSGAKAWGAGDPDSSSTPMRGME